MGVLGALNRPCTLMLMPMFDPPTASDRGVDVLRELDRPWRRECLDCWSSAVRGAGSFGE